MVMTLSGWVKAHSAGAKSQIQGLVKLIFPDRNHTLKLLVLHLFTKPTFSNISQFIATESA